MRATFAVLGTVLVVTAVVAGASVSAEGAPRQVRPPRVVGFDVSVTFFLNSTVQWRLKRGVQAGCNPWRDDSGQVDIFAHNQGSAERRPRLKPLQGRYFPSLESILPPGVHVPRGALPRSWAEMSVLGPAKGSISGLWIQRGGPATTPCDGQPVSPFVSSPDDCGRKEFALGLRTPAIIRAEFRTRGTALNEVTAGNARSVADDGLKPVLSVTVPTGIPFKKCPYAAQDVREVIAGMGVPVPPDKVRALRNLGVNEKVRVEARLAGPCDDDQEREDPAHEFGYCKYTLRGWIEIRRIQRRP